MEADFIAWLRGRLPAHPRLLLGIGDDAAVLQLGRRGQCVVTTDLLSDGVDFLLNEIDGRRAGRKALAANLSDLAAMAATPLAVVVALALPRAGGGQLAVELYEGMLPLAEKYSVAIAGGDTNSWDGPLAIAITAIGEPTDRGPLLRSGARPGDRILVTGEFGGSILGKHLDFDPRVLEALLLHERFQIHAGMDCSDGLSLDLSRMATASGCGALLELDRVPVSTDARALADRRASAATALDHALGDGEDFELILAVDSASAAKIIDEQPLAPLRVTDIGQFIAESGLWRLVDGVRQPLAVHGFQHQFD